MPTYTSIEKLTIWTPHLPITKLLTITTWHCGKALMHLRSSPDSMKQSTASINQAMKIYNEGNQMEAVWVPCGLKKVMGILTTSRYHCQKTSHGDQRRGLLGGHQDKATAGDVEWMAYGRIKILWLNGIPNGMPNNLTGALPSSYRQAEGPPAGSLPRHQPWSRLRGLPWSWTIQYTKSTKSHWNTGATRMSLCLKSFIRGRRIWEISIRKRSHKKITGKDHRKRTWEKREVNQHIHWDALRVAHQEAVYQVV